MKRLTRCLLATLVFVSGAISLAASAAEASRTLAVAAAPDRDYRVALVIGNSRYPSGALANPKNDATAMAAALAKLGFDVELKLDATRSDLNGLFKRFSSKAGKASVAALFYAGHGIQVNGGNYLVPIDASPESERDLKRETVRMDDVIDDMGDAKVKLVFFDACRDNPLARSFSRGGSRGMAAPVEATGTLISFATKHGNTAADGHGKHSPYTAALLAALENPNGIEIEQLLRRVQQGVKRATNGQQEPWRYGSLDGDFYFKAVQGSSGVAAVQQEAIDRAVFDAVQVAKEEAARERAQLQQAMEKMLKEALARQNAAIEAERAARVAANGGAASASASSAIGAAPPASPRPPIQLASLAPSGSGPGSLPSAQALGANGSTQGDEWEYVSRDIFGKRQTVVGRVKAVVPGMGVLEEYLVDGETSGEWVFDGRPSLLGVSIDAALLFSPYWSGEGIDKLAVLNGSKYAVQTVTAKVVGNERISTAAGSFATKKLELNVTVAGQRGWPGYLEIVVWYSMDQNRLVRQTVKGKHGWSADSLNTINETIELAAIRPAAR